MSKAEQHWLMTRAMSVQVGATVDFVGLATALSSQRNGEFLPYLARCISLNGTWQSALVTVGGREPLIRFALYYMQPRQRKITKL